MYSNSEVRTASFWILRRQTRNMVSMSEMIPNLEDRFRQLLPQRDELLFELEAEAERDNVPIVGPVVGELLGILARLACPGLVVELGTATGYSAVYLSRACAETGGRLLTFEYDPELAERARETLRQSGAAAHAEVRTGDALEILAAFNEPVRMVFLDIEKKDYIRALPHCERLVEEGGLLVADNTGFAGAEPFIDAIEASGAWRTVHFLAHLPLHSPELDGLTIAMRILTSRE